jgi:hypothetical protein
MKNKKGNRFTDRTGEKYTTNEGYNVEIIEYFSACDITIKYEDGTVLHKIFFSALKSGQVRKPQNRVGEKYVNKEGQEAEIIEYESSLNVTVRFEDNAIVSNLQYDNIKRGAFKNPYIKNIYSFGYIGDMRNTNKDSTYNKIYSTWVNMIKRCYDERELNKYPSYRKITVTDEWCCFENFYKWAVLNYNPEYMQNWQLDKDILIKGNKIYSPDTCCFVPSAINNLFIKSNSIRGNLPIGVHKEGNKFKTAIKIKGKQKTLKRCNTPEEAFQVYKVAKEQYIKEVADKWKDLIDPRVYQAMYNYQVEITD